MLLGSQSRYQTLNNCQDISNLKRKHTSYEYSSKYSENGDEFEKICAVCGDVSSGKHYGSPSCDGCRGFFKRCVRYGSDFSCIRANGMCIMTPSTRTRCQSCRYQKCLAVGMTRTAVQTPRSIKEIHLKENFEVPRKIRRNECCSSQKLFIHSDKKESPNYNNEHSFGFDITNILHTPNEEFDYSKPIAVLNVCKLESDLENFDVERVKDRQNASDVNLYRCGWIDKHQLKNRRSAFKILIEESDDKDHEKIIRYCINTLINIVCLSRLCKDMPDSDVLLTLQAVWRPLFLLLIALSDDYIMDENILGEDLYQLLKVIRLCSRSLNLNRNENMFKITANMLIETAAQSSSLYSKYGNLMRTSTAAFCNNLENIQVNSLHECAEIMTIIGLCLCVMNKEIDNAVQWPGISNINSILQCECESMRMNLTKQSDMKL